MSYQQENKAFGVGIIIGIFSTVMILGLVLFAHSCDSDKRMGVLNQKRACFEATKKEECWK